MTTNVLDIQNKMMTSDSRWSNTTSRAIFYIDNTDFDKMCVNGNCAFMFAGDGNLIQEWKDWVFDTNRDVSKFPDVEREYPNGKKFSISLCGIIISSGKICVERGLMEFENAKFAGTGGVYALQCWTKNRCAKKAIETASSWDSLSGGRVAYANLEDGSHNTKNNCTVFDVSNDLRIRGFKMNKDTKEIISMRDVAANDPDVIELWGDSNASNLKAVVNAPCESMYIPWTEQEKLDLATGLKEMFG